MSRVVHTYQVPMATPRAAAIEVEVIERGPPGRWRIRIALWLVRLAGRLARMRVRVVKELPRLPL